MLMVEQSIYPPSDNKPLMWLSQLVANTMENTLKTLPGYVVYELLPSRGKNQKTSMIYLFIKIMELAITSKTV